jgi:hypothetical protein
MNCICIGLILCFIGSVASLIVTFIGIVEINSKAIELYKLNMESQLVTS